METVATTKMSSKGQVVIPENVRTRMGLAASTEFIVLGEGDVVILKTIQAPAMEEFHALIKKARRQAKRAGLKRSDIAKAVRDVRTKK